jgi:DNA replication factor GINS
LNKVHNRLYSAWRKEKFDSEDLQPLEPHFFTEIGQYIKNIHEELRMLDEKTLKYRILNMELDNAKKLFSSLMETRLQKLISDGFEHKDLSRQQLASEESSIYKKVLEAFEDHDNLRKRILEGRTIDSGPKADLEIEKTVVRFTAKIPAIVALDMETYGPFEPEDVATLPRDNAEALIRQKAAVKIEMKS